MVAWFCHLSVVACCVFGCCFVAESQAVMWRHSRGVHSTCRYKSAKELNQTARHFTFDEDLDELANEMGLGSSSSSTMVNAAGLERVLHRKRMRAHKKTGAASTPMSSASSAGITSPTMTLPSGRRHNSQRTGSARGGSNHETKGSDTAATATGVAAGGVEAEEDDAVAAQVSTHPKRPKKIEVNLQLEIVRCQQCGQLAWCWVVFLCPSCML